MIGKKIKELRIKFDMTQAELADLLNMTYQAISKWERGESCPDVNTLIKISKIFNVKLDFFNEYDEEIK